MIRESLITNFIDPLIVQPSRQMAAFRIVWSHRGPAELDSAWLDIHSLRLACDEIIRHQPSVDFFFSSVAGLYNKSCPRSVARELGIRPSVSYYVACSGGGGNEDDVDGFWKPRLEGQLPGNGPQLKAIHVRSLASADAAAVAAPLYNVLKDHSSAYVQEQVDRSVATSARVLNAPGQDGKAAPALGTIAKLIVVNPQVETEVVAAYSAIMKSSANFYLHLGI